MESSIEKRIHEIGREIFKRSQSISHPFLLNKQLWSAKMVSFVMEHQGFKNQLFRFIDVLPSLKNHKRIAEHIQELFLEEKNGLSCFPLPLKRMTRFSLNLSQVMRALASIVVKKSVESLSQTFIAGRDSKEAWSTLEEISREKRSFTVDILGEATLSAKEADDYQKRYLELIRGLAEKSSQLQLKSKKNLSTLPHTKEVANVSIKLSSLSSQISNEGFDYSVHSLLKVLRPLAREALRHKVFLYIDMETYATKNLILEIFERLVLEKEFQSSAFFGIVLQTYLRSVDEDALRMIRLSKKRTAPITVRLVKGAYWDQELIHAKALNWPVPVWINKGESDLKFERVSQLLLENHPHILTALASHNIRSLAHGIAQAEALQIPKEEFELQMLYGMGSTFKNAFTSMGFRLREYVPMGEMLPGMAYLVRRLLENTSNQGFLVRKWVQRKEDESLLNKPEKESEKNDESTPISKRPKPFSSFPLFTVRKSSNKIKKSVMSEPKKEETEEVFFSNHPTLDFSLLENREALDLAIKNSLKKPLIQSFPVISGNTLSLLETEACGAPEDSSLLITNLALSTKEQAELAAQSAKEGMKSWSQSSLSFRLKCLQNLADLLEKKRFELIARMILEVGKTAVEADQDVCEGVDFCRYYARQMTFKGTPRETERLYGEKNETSYRAKGPALVLAPWNFPLAILCGLTVAPLVCGNTVIMKPAEQASGIASLFFDLALKAGVPPSALHFLPGKGEVLGAYLCTHPEIHIINFTGSREVGLEILKQAHTPSSNQKHIKRVVAEMGGKNALIIDASADLDTAIEGALHSAFGFQGQKCSALDRILVHQECYEVFKTRFIEAFLSLRVSSPLFDRASQIGPVIDKDSQLRLLSLIERNKDKIIAKQPLKKEFLEKGHYVPPTLFEETWEQEGGAFSNKQNQKNREKVQGELFQEEFFGPLALLCPIRSLEHGIDLMNSSDYALTGGLYSRSPRSIEKVRQKAEVGNLYINRNITGALVRRQPFGGFKLSGVGAKAGGENYLLQFLEPITQSENLIRRGFSPDFQV